MIINYEECKIFLEDGRVIYLTKIETRILQILYENRNRVVKHEEIAKKIYETEIDVRTKNTITTHIVRLKKKINKYIEIKTVRQVGYIIKK